MFFFISQSGIFFLGDIQHILEQNQSLSWLSCERGLDVLMAVCARVMIMVFMQCMQ